MKLGTAMAAGAILAVGATLVTVSAVPKPIVDAAADGPSCHSYEEQKSVVCRAYYQSLLDAGTP